MVQIIAIVFRRSFAGQRRRVAFSCLSFGGGGGDGWVRDTSFVSAACDRERPLPKWLLERACLSPLVEEVFKRTRRWML